MCTNTSGKYMSGHSDCGLLDGAGQEARDAHEHRVRLERAVAVLKRVLVQQEHERLAQEDMVLGLPRRRGKHARQPVPVEGGGVRAVKGTVLEVRRSRRELLSARARRRPDAAADGAHAEALLEVGARARRS